MFGTYRTFLALLVVVHHLGGVPAIGGYAVFGFYTLSGYLMTLVVQRRYGYSASGTARYALNRFLRIYPIYWLSCLSSLLVILVAGASFTTGFHSALFPPHDAVSTLRNLLIVFPRLEEPRLVPPAWALTVELFYYGCIGLGLSRTKGIALAWFGASVAYHVVVVASGTSWTYRYFPIPAASLPFATGAVLFFHGEDLRERLGRWIGRPFAPHLLGAAFVVNWYVGAAAGTMRGLSFYASYAIGAATVLSLAKRRTLPWVSRRADALLGDYSYPIYLIHFQVGLLMFLALDALGLPVGRWSSWLVIATIPPLFAVAWVMIATLERPIEAVRARVKPR